MESTSDRSNVIDVDRTFIKHREIVQKLLPAHALSSNDSVKAIYNLGKLTVLSTLQTGGSLELLGDLIVKNIYSLLKLQGLFFAV